VNGVDLSKCMHNYTKDAKYDAELYRLLNSTSNAEELREALDVIGKRLASGRDIFGKLINC
jgi:hypothetical protein